MSFDSYWIVVAVVVALLFLRVIWRSVRQSGNSERLFDTNPRDTAAEGDGVWEAEVLAMVRAGKKIQAIKLYREHTRVGLKEAKDFVESLLQ